MTWVQCTSQSNECLGGCRSMKEHDRYRHGQLLKKHERLKESLRRVLVLHEEPWHGPNNYCECDVCEAARAALKDEAP